MDSSHPPFPVQHPDTRHANHVKPQLLSQVQTQVEYLPPTKRRRANSGNPSLPSSTADPRPLAPLPPPTPHWQSRHSQPLPPKEYLIESSAPRSVSPDQVSRVSTTSSQPLGGPQLRKKPKSSSIKHTQLQRVANTFVVKSPSLPTFHSPVGPDSDSVTTPDSTGVGTGLTISRTNSQQLSPNQKRPPASHSSYGVETTCGPPPSYSTQRTLSQERIRKLDRNTQTRMQPSTSEPAQGVALDETPPAHTHQKESAHSLIQSSPDTADTQSIPTPTEYENVNNISVRGEQRPSMDEETKASSSDERKSEDLFLNIARHDAARPVQPKGEKRRSRISIPFLPSNRSTNVAKSSPIQSQPEHNPIVSPRSEAPNFHNKRASLGGYIPSAYGSRNHLVEDGRFRESSGNRTSDRDQSGLSNAGSGLRRSSTTNTETTRLIHRSSAGLRYNRLVSDTTQMDRPKTVAGDQVATESTISTTAPSTVWDELDDLKSRIRKLELTGKLPPSSAAAMGVTERPRTATTAATTMSTSPKYKPSEPSFQSATESTLLNIHPLLHEALDNARIILNPEIFQKLQATAQDALQLAAMMSAENSGSRNYTAPPNNERQIRRRTESMCRGLTELAIALAAEAKPLQPSGRSASRDQSLPPNSMLRSRRYSNDPADRTHVSARVQSRVDNRRTSVHLGRNGTGYTSPEHGLYQSPVSGPQMSETRLTRSSLLRKRGQGSFDGINEQYDVSPSIRPGSRAMTELSPYRRISRDDMQAPRGGASQYPLSTQQDAAIAVSSIAPLPANHSVSFTSRRKYASPASVVSVQEDNPVTPRDGWGRTSMVSADVQSPDVVSERGGSGRMGSSRRSLGVASRIGSSVGSRLRAVRAERDSREHTDGRGAADFSSMLHDDSSTHFVDRV